MYEKGPVHFQICVQRTRLCICLYNWSKYEVWWSTVTLIQGMKSTLDAMWWTFGYALWQQSYIIVRLPVHLPVEQNIIVRLHNLNKEPNAKIQRAQIDSMLTAWFMLNMNNKDIQSISYSETPKYFVLDKKKREWHPWKDGGDNVIGRMYSVSLGSDFERYFLRLIFKVLLCSMYLELQILKN